MTMPDRHPFIILDPDHTALMRELDRIFTSWAGTYGASEICPPPVYPVNDLARLDVYKNFPHLAFVAGSLKMADGGYAEPENGSFPPEAVDPLDLGLPNATCYGAYLFFRDRQVPADTTVTLINRCFRHEDHYEGLRRLLSFNMREIVAIGDFEHTQNVIADFSEKILSFAEQLSLKLEKVAASDPFFQSGEEGSARALMQNLSPVKHEFQVGELAIASVNTHRNFFGERCAITVSGSPGYAFSSCVAFGLERWLAVLTDQYGGDLKQALYDVSAVGSDVS